MRETTDVKRIETLFQLLGRRCRRPIDVYLAGGATAVLNGWRATTIDVDLKALPDSDAFLRKLPAIKEELKINIELASPAIDPQLFRKAVLAVVNARF